MESRFGRGSERDLAERPFAARDGAIIGRDFKRRSDSRTLKGSYAPETIIITSVALMSAATAYSVGGDNRCDVLPTDRDPHPVSYTHLMS